MSDMLSQEEINALLAGASDDVGNAESEGTEGSLLTEEEKDALGEIGNISMGTAATTLFTLLNQKVTITTPRVTEVTVKEVFERFDDPCVTIDVRYTQGIEGTNLMILNSRDVKVITDLMLGGDGTNIEGELSEMHLSAISEAMNQMIGSSSTSLSEMIGKMVDISPPFAICKPMEEMLDELVDFPKEEPTVMISFEMKVGDLVDSEIMQMMPIEMAKNMINSMMGGPKLDEDIASEPTPLAEEPVISPVQAEPAIPISPQPAPMADYSNLKPSQPVNASTVSFENFAPGIDLTHIASDIALIKEVPLEITVELGRTVKKISEILEFAEGTIVELDKIVGEPLDILANGRMIAKGEVVVIEENYGVRITEIVVPKKD